MAKKLESIGKDIWSHLRERLAAEGLDLDGICCEAGGEGPAKVVCLSADLQDGLRELCQTTRDQVVMVRVDEPTLRDLDAWVQTGAVKSRSEGAALFIREGLRVRADELAQLADALADVEQARGRLRQRAQDVLGGKADA